MSRGGGRGRGRGMTLNIEAIGFARGDTLPTAILQPPPKFPPLHQPPLPLLTGNNVDYILSLQKEFRQTMRNSPYYIYAEEKFYGVERYSDKYRAQKNTDSTIEWKPDFRRLPKELKIAVRKKRKLPKHALAPNLKNKSKPTKEDENEIKQKLEALVKQDSENPAGKTSDKEDSENDEAVEEEELEEVNEEENDYMTSYFDNGESFLDEDEDNLDDKDGGIY